MNRGSDVAVGDKWKDHDKVKPLPALPDDGIMGDLEVQYSPFLFTADGCIPYPAVDGNGYAGAGLKPTGESGSGCRDFGQPGQT
ncbi:hypothetical protein LY78DRAFT_697918 [Colletotrichum sublineola]|nr:hypothetical protein LY78DRAFT_697918 [Colletotrichum sublineola]